MNRRRVVITGLGAVTPLAVGVEASWRALCAGKSGIGHVTRFDATSFKCKVAGEVNDFHPEDFIHDAKFKRRLDRFIHFAVACSSMALEDSRLVIDSSNSERVGVVLGSAVGARGTGESAHEMVLDGHADRVSPFFLVNITPNMGAGVVAILTGARGVHHCLSDACATGTNSLGLAMRVIQYDEADAVIAGAADSGLTPTVYAGLEATGATTRRNQSPEKASRPFDADRDGMVCAEGGAVVILEELGHALRRGARIYAEVLGYGSNVDAFHVTSPSTLGEGPAQCMGLALKDSGIEPQQVDYVNAHGTSTVANDVAETCAIKKVFGGHANKLAVSSNKSMTGHMWGAAGTVEAVFSVLTIRDGIIPPTINYEHPDPECDLDYVPNESRRAQVKIAMSNSFGFGGINGCLVIKQFEE
ncbi:MAG: beta-ketoacyl-ACP synthase II [Dehalococcoidia bacterium]|jgi:3-oxoacyl-[acyl-carrier-protein] synthase II|nr:beta-ketoacyl-ACP synthase II [Dehalococcoidia bacterium]